MFLHNRRARSGLPARQPSRLVEFLKSRWCPVIIVQLVIMGQLAALISASAAPPPLPKAPAPAPLPLPKAAPVPPAPPWPSPLPKATPPVLFFSVSNPQGKTVEVNGLVTGSFPAGAKVVFHGAIEKAITADGSGHFHFETPGLALGKITGVATNSKNVSSAVQSVVLTSPPPKFISFTVAHNSLKYWIFQGRVADHNGSHISVALSGLAEVSGTTMTTDAQGSFHVVKKLPANALGTVVGTVTDVWGQKDTAHVLITPVDS